MKKLLIVLAAVSGLTFSANQASANNVEAHLHNMQNRIRSCTVLPYTVKNGVKVLHQLISHCSEVKMVEKYRAHIKIGGSTFVAQLRESADTDGDFYDVVIRDYISNESFTMHNVLAFGDVLRGVLGGDIKNVQKVYVPGLR